MLNLSRAHRACVAHLECMCVCVCISIYTHSRVQAGAAPDRRGWAGKQGSGSPAVPDAPAASARDIYCISIYTYLYIDIHAPGRRGWAGKQGAGCPAVPDAPAASARARAGSMRAPPRRHAPLGREGRPRDKNAAPDEIQLYSSDFKVAKQCATEVAQLYVRDVVSSVTTPVQKLVGFQR